VAEPAAQPVGDARDSVEFLLQVASRLGGVVASAFPWQSPAQIVQETCRGLFEAKRGYVVSSPQEESFRRILESQGFRDPEFTTFDDFWTALLLRGAWWDPTDTASDPGALFRTESGRFEFYSRRLEGLFLETARREAGDDPSAQARAAERLRTGLGLQAEGDRLFLPHHETHAHRAEQTPFPLVLRPFLLLTLGSGEMANAPWIQEDLAVHVDSAWDSWVELNPVTAREAGVGHGDLVWIESSKGRLRTRVRVFEGTMPGIVAMPLGQGHHALGSRARGRGANPLDLVENMQDSRAGMAALGLTPVRVTRA
jgi:anaerobic selenocysteine-containing dehydrogenase